MAGHDQCKVGFVGKLFLSGVGGGRARRGIMLGTFFSGKPRSNKRSRSWIIVRMGSLGIQRPGKGRISCHVPLSPLLTYKRLPARWNFAPGGHLQGVDLTRLKMLCRTLLAKIQAGFDGMPSRPLQTPVRHEKDVLFEPPVASPPLFRGDTYSRGKERQKSGGFFYQDSLGQT